MDVSKSAVKSDFAALLRLRCGLAQAFFVSSMRGVLMAYGSRPGADWGSSTRIERTERERPGE